MAVVATPLPPVLIFGGQSFYLQGFASAPIGTEMTLGIFVPPSEPEWSGQRLF